MAVPSTPRGLSIVNGNGTLYLSWLAPFTTGGVPIIEYVINQYAGGSVPGPVGTGELIAQVHTGSIDTSYVFTGLTNFDFYDFTVVAVNSFGDSVPSGSPGWYAGVPTIPDTPTNVLSFRADEGINVSWTIPASDGGSSIIEYTVTSQPGNFVVTSAINSCHFSSLIENTYYTFTVTATNGVGTSPSSVPSYAVSPKVMDHDKLLLADGISSALYVDGSNIGLISFKSPPSSLVNNGFESGDFTGWMVSSEGAGSWFVADSDVAPLSTFSVPYPIGGSYVAIADESDPFSSVLFQDFFLYGLTRYILTFKHYYHNYATSSFPPYEPFFVTEDSLSMDIYPNQQYRVDIMNPASDPFSVDPADVLMSVFQTEPGDPESILPTLVNVDLTDLADQQIRLRFAIVANNYYFNVGVDDVYLSSGGISGLSPVGSNIIKI